MTEKKTAAKPADEKTAKIRCTVDTEPWTDERPLALDEVATVPEDIAKVLVGNKQAVRV